MTRMAVSRTAFGYSMMASVLAFAFVGCNAILDNQPGTMLETTEAGTEPPPGPAPAPSEQPAPMTDAGTPEQDSGEKPSPNCPVGQQMCFGACVSMTDPLYGCGNPSCTACPAMHSSSACQGRKCVVASCDKGYADCNSNPGDGCETDLSKSTSCGACNAVCAPAAPLCAPSGASFQCENGCAPGAPLNCGAECVDPLTSVNNCGACNMKCPAVANGTAACTLGACTFTCKAQFHACADKCVAKTDPATCGPDCTPCPVPAGGTATCVADVCGVKCNAGLHACGNTCVTATDPNACGPACTVCPAVPNATPTCAGNTCGFTCTAGFGNCDANAANGCEATFASDPLNCGMCGKSCNGQACVNGVCNAPPPPP